MTRPVFRGPVERQLLAVFETHLYASLARAIEVTGAQRRTAQSVMSRLVREGELSKTGAHKRTEYFMTERQRRAAFGALPPTGDR